MDGGHCFVSLAETHADKDVQIDTQKKLPPGISVIWGDSMERWGGVAVLYRSEMLSGKSIQPTAELRPSCDDGRLLITPMHYRFCKRVSLLLYSVREGDFEVNDALGPGALQRRRQIASAIKRDAEQRGLPAIIGGDFNEETRVRIELGLTSGPSRQPPTHSAATSGGRLAGAKGGRCTEAGAHSGRVLARDPQQRRQSGLVDLESVCGKPTLVLVELGIWELDASASDSAGGSPSQPHEVDARIAAETRKADTSRRLGRGKTAIRGRPIVPRTDPGAETVTTTRTRLMRADLRRIEQARAARASNGANSMHFELAWEAVGQSLKYLRQAEADALQQAKTTKDLDSATVILSEALDRQTKHDVW